MNCPQTYSPVLLKDVVARHPGSATAYLKVAEGGLYGSPTIVQTVLGSCLAAVFYAPDKRAGAMFHAFLPRREEYAVAPGDSIFKFVDTAIPHVVGLFARRGIRVGDLRVSLVGGANGLVDEQCGVGRKNADCALEICHRLGIKPMAIELGGEKGRKVLFETSTGELYVNILNGIGPK